MNRVNICRLALLSALLGVTLIPQEAQAYGPVDSAPPPETPPPGGNNTNQGIEGINEIIATTDNPSFIRVSEEFTVDGIDGLPNPDNVIGEGNLLDIVKSAGNVWETAFPGLTDNVSLRVGWADFGADLTDPILAGAVNSGGLDPDGILSFYIHGGNSFPNNSEDDPGIPLNPDSEVTEPGLLLFSAESNGELALPAASEDELVDGVILFNSRPLKGDVDGDGMEERILLYLDDDPLNSDVFGSLEDVADDDRVQGGINYGRSTFKQPEDFNSPENNIVVGENDIVIDAFSVALHELQHNLGLTRGNPNAKSTLIEDDINSNGSLSDFKIDIDFFDTIISTTSSDTIIPTTFDKDDPDPSLHIFDNLDGKAEKGR